MKRPDAPAHNYVGDFEKRLLTRYRDILARNDKETSILLNRKIDLQGELEDGQEKRATKNNRMKEYLSFWSSLTEKEQYRIACEDAKVNYLARLARTIGTTDVVQAHNKIRSTTAGSFDYVLRRFREEGVTGAQLQRFIDENAVAWISLTGHPTNPTTVAFTKAQINLARVLTDGEACTENLDAALQEIYDAPIIGERKTPLDEAEEILATLETMFDTTLPLKEFFESALKETGYGAEDVALYKPIIVPCAWTLGDGDGNENLTAPVLKDGIALHRKKIAQKYLQKLEGISFSSTVKSEVEDIRAALKKQAETGEKAFPSKNNFIDGLDRLCASASGGNKKLVQDISYLVKCFGLGYGTIDIRHNAIEIMETAQRLASIAGLEEYEELKKSSLGKMVMHLTNWLEDQESIEKLSQLTEEKIRNSGDDAAARIFGRLRVIGENPDMCEKLIIAETTHQAHALAALLLLKITGNKIAEEDSKIDLTILSESVKDLAGLGNTLELLLENDTFRRHVSSRNRLLVMIAKSDTTRQDGRGEAEYMQYETAVDIYRVADRMKRKYAELENISVSIKNGGGHALQRGGGRVTEIAALHGRAAADARVTDIGPSTLTVQGEQLTILFCPGKVALGSLEAFIAQNLYTKAGVRGEMPMPHIEKGINKQFAAADAWLYAKSAGRAFDQYTKQSSAIDHLLLQAPWLSMKAGNASSRPAKRGEKSVEPGITPEEAKGEDPKALQGRAISGERLTAHACLPVFSVLGLYEAMVAVRDHGQARINPEKYGEALHHLYRAHKLHRDGARVTINAVPMADFDIAWPLLTGRIRPKYKEIVLLAQQFDKQKEISREVTLAYLEMYFVETDKLSYEMVSGQKARQSFRLGDALRKLWPELAQQVAHRDRAAEFARVIECHRTREFDRHADTPLSELQFRITQALYAASNVVNAPVGILATRTRLEPVYEISNGKRTRFMRPESFNEEEVYSMLKLPPALTA